MDFGACHASISSRSRKISIVAIAEKTRDDDVDVDPGVRDAVRGIYKLWSVTRRGRSQSLDADVEKDLFLEVVRDALKC